MKTYVGRITRLDFNIEAENAEEAQTKILDILSQQEGTDGLERLYTDGNVEVEIEATLDGRGNMVPLEDEDEDEDED